MQSAPTSQGIIFQVLWHQKSCIKNHRYETDTRPLQQMNTPMTGKRRSSMTASVIGLMCAKSCPETPSGACFLPPHVQRALLRHPDMRVLGPSIPQRKTRPHPPLGCGWCRPCACVVSPQGPFVGLTARPVPESGGEPGGTRRGVRHTGRRRSGAARPGR